MTDLREKKRVAFFRGHSAERFAAMVLLLKGFRIVARRYRTRLGEIDLIARRGNLVLIVEVNGESAECDLVTAVRLRIRGRPVPAINRGWVFDVLYAYQDGTATPARLVLAGPGWYLLTGQQFRRLAEIISTRHDAGNRTVRTIIRRLTRMAGAPPDWNFRTDPQELRNSQKPQD